ncbi:MAG TPA: toprim domain-containing protein, partial [Nitrospirae bacterium]|nr:toprim domain-containing protein [Nitrospirota bacterium]
IGWAPDEWEALTGHLLKSGFDQKTLESAGLSKLSSKGSLIDRFRGRLMFPISSFGGKTIAFGARLIDDGDKQAPKYINSPETPVYSKRSVLYGLNLAKNAARRENSLIVVEGYMDALALRSAGIDNCAAVSGTAFTSMQAEAIRRVCENVVVLFDSDTAGMAAAKKSVPILLDIGLRVKALSLPGVKDPDEFIKARGKDKFLQLMAKAPPFPLFIIDSAMSGVKLGSVEEKTRAVRDAIPFLRRIQDNIERSQYVQILAERAGIDIKTLQAEVGARPKAQTQAGRAETPGKKKGAQFLAEKILLRILLENQEYLESHAPELSENNFKTQDHRDIYRLILEARDKGLDATADIVGLAVDDRLRKNLTELSLEMNLFDEKDIEQVVSDCANLALYSPEARRRTLKEQAMAAKSGESDKFIEAKKKYMESRRHKV